MKILKPFIRKILHFIALMTWKCKATIPKNYDFIYLASHSVGHNAMLSFLMRCGVCLNWHYAQSGKERFMDIYKMLIIQKCKGFLAKNHNVIAISEFGFADKEEFCARFTKKTPILFLVRDPISMLKSIINIPVSLNTSRIYTLDTTYEQILRVGFLDLTPKYISSALKNLDTAKQKPYLEGIKSLACDNERTIFIQNSLYEAFKDKAEYIHYVDMQEITTKNAFATMQNLAHKFGFAPPQDEEVFTSKMYGELSGIIPFELKCALSNGTQITLLITTAQHPAPKHYIQITQNLCDTLPFGNIKIYTLDSAYKALQGDTATFARVREYLSGFMEALPKKVEIVESYKITEKEVLEYLSTHKDARQMLKATLDSELTHIKKSRPDIIQSWKHYACFEAMCEDL